MIYKVYNDHYVAAVLTGTKQLGEWLSKVPKELCDQLVVEPIRLKTYPIHIVEGIMNGKRIYLECQQENLRQTKATVVACGANVICTFILEKDFLGDPKNPGRDYMGALNHEHEDEEE